MKASPNRSSGAGLPRAADGARRSSSRPKSTARWATGRTNAGCRPSTSGAPAKTACAACKPITSTCTRCTTLIATRPGKKSGRRWSSWFSEGKVIYVGSSNFAGWHIAQAQCARRTASFHGPGVRAEPLQPGGAQIELEVIPACQALRPGLIPWSPLAAGLLGGVLQKAERRAAAPKRVCRKKSRNTVRRSKL